MSQCYDSRNSLGQSDADCTGVVRGRRRLFCHRGDDESQVQKVFLRADMVRFVHSLMTPSYRNLRRAYIINGSCIKVIFEAVFRPDKSSVTY